jgi:hypothetical protein
MVLANGYLAELVDAIWGNAWALGAVALTTAAGVAAAAISRRVRRRLVPVKVRKQ